MPESEARFQRRCAKHCLKILPTLQVFALRRERHFVEVVRLLATAIGKGGCAAAVKSSDKIGAVDLERWEFNGAMLFLNRAVALAVMTHRMKRAPNWTIVREGDGGRGLVALHSFKAVAVNQSSYRRPDDAQPEEESAHGPNARDLTEADETSSSTTGPAAVATQEANSNLSGSVVSISRPEGAGVAPPKSLATLPSWFCEASLYGILVFWGIVALVVPVEAKAMGNDSLLDPVYRMIIHATHSFLQTFSLCS